MPPRHLPSSARLIALAAAVCLSLGLLPAGSGAAALTPSAAEARRQAASLQQRMEKATEDYDLATVLVARSQQREKSLRAGLAAQQARLAAYGKQVGEFAAATYRSGRIGVVNSLLGTGSPQEFLDQMSTLDNLSRTQRAQLNRLVAARRTLDRQYQQIKGELAAQRRQQQTLRSSKTGIERDLAKWAVLNGQLNPRASRSGRPPIGATYTGAATGNARTALKVAAAQLGKPYVWGAAGPESFDCSGLTMYAWRAAGVSLPHSSRLQYNSGPHVARAALQPGDLVFFGSPISHVGIFVSGDTIIGAPTAGDVVKYQSISGMGKPYAGAIRP